MGITQVPVPVTTATLSEGEAGTERDRIDNRDATEGGYLLFAEADGAVDMFDGRQRTVG